MASLGQYKGKEITPGDQASIQSQMKQIDSVATAPQGNLSTRASTIANTPINPTRITPSQGTFNPPTASTASNTAVAVDTVANRAPSVMPAPVEPTMTKSQTMLQKMLPSNPQMIQEEKAEARRNADLQNKMELSNKAQNEIKVQKRAYEDQIEKIRTNTDGKSTAQLNNEMNDFARKADRHLADKAITAELLLNNYVGAEKILNAQLDDMQQNYDNEVKSYQIAKDFIFNDLTDSEKAELDFNQQQNAADYQLERQKILSAFNQKLEQADPMYALDLKFKQAQINSANRANRISDTESASTGTISGKPQNVSQSAANSYANRLNQANVSIDNIGKKFTGKFSFGGLLPNMFQSGDRQVFEQAKNNFGTAILRRESGAAISPTEFATMNKTYFPVAGDSQKVIIEKENLRNTAINNFYREADVLRPVLPNMIIKDSSGKRYKVGLDGETLTEI